ncbi:NlpC/P60 family protein [Sediminispirochaeta bajacaliforniensis]|uniref:NlpC/P60 family protein n=1 Tax=Sediminispirochaeta bajacaliforniensis TaxID=148 RepID=UPI00036933CF|nr:NlpC/P60 family protein [Sediminispirochaeta bajacaliforniensis]
MADVNIAARGSTLLFLVVGAYAALILSSCASLSPIGSSRTSPSAMGNMLTGPAAETQQALIDSAYTLLGKKRLAVKGKNFRLDCTGVVQAVYWGAGIDLVAPLSRYTGNGVSRLYAYLNDQGLLEEASTPSPGDLIFWDDTYDRNGNGKVDDPLTHIGMVVNVWENGDLEYIHHNYRKGIVLEKMNHKTPSLYTREENGKSIIVNSPMRMRGSPAYDKTLSGELVHAWGHAYLLAY